MRASSSIPSAIAAGPVSSRNRAVPSPTVDGISPTSLVSSAHPPAIASSSTRGWASTGNRLGKANTCAASNSAFFSAPTAPGIHRTDTDADRLIRSTFSSIQADFDSTVVNRVQKAENDGGPHRTASTGRPRSRSARSSSASRNSGYPFDSMSRLRWSSRIGSPGARACLSATSSSESGTSSHVFSTMATRSAGRPHSRSRSRWVGPRTVTTSAARRMRRSDRASGWSRSQPMKMLPWSETTLGTSGRSRSSTSVGQPILAKATRLWGRFTWRTASSRRTVASWRQQSAMRAA